ncbi:hypothetical protein RRG08_042931 [Elysia crispata]|uniref:Uncharacterized protein n=1 Tax=Elysia crispata TaxID=231223 RepID=A0AAE1E4V8_9GAST|nr:hypothetical protein RRG08_042931 [Elysia crispata]
MRLGQFSLFFAPGMTVLSYTDTLLSQLVSNSVSSPRDSRARGESVCVYVSGKENHREWEWENLQLATEPEALLEDVFGESLLNIAGPGYHRVPGFSSNERPS